MVIADLGSGGAQHVLTHFANHWAAQGRRVGVVTLAGPETDFFKLDGRVERFVTGGIANSATFAGGMVRNLSRIWRLRRVLKSYDADTVIGFIAPVNILVILATAGLGMRVVISERNDPSRQSFGRAWDFMRKWLYRKADVVTANSTGALDAMRAFVPDSKLTFLPNPLRLPPRGRHEPGTRLPIFLSVGRLSRQKAHDVSICAFAQVADALPDWRLVIIGEGGERASLEALVREHGLEGRVELPGIEADPFPRFTSASVFVFVSRHEGMPNALLEAMASGLPAIVSDANSTQLELVRDGEEGCVVAVEDGDALAAAMLRLARSADERLRMGALAVKSAMRFSPDKVESLWDSLIWDRD